MIPPAQLSGPTRVLPFWLSLTFLPLILLAAYLGGLWLLAVPLYTWGGFAIMDRLTGPYTENADPETPEAQLFWYRLITLIWLPIQMLLIFGSLWAAIHGAYSWWEKLLWMFGIGVASGTVGINYAHELMHRKDRLSRWLADILMASVLYGHFRSEHLLVHHRYVGTPRDPVTARYNEGFHRFFARVLPGCIASSWRAEKAMLARAGRAPFDPANPFWRYGALAGGMLLLAALIGGWQGVGLFAFQALVAIWQLELVNYVEHYGLTRKYLGAGRYEHIRPHHSWNAAFRASNWLLINLQRHSDHHYRPDRPFPLLQNYTEAEAPQLPYGYPVATAVAMVPPLWRRIMNHRVRRWRGLYYPEIVDWAPYKSGNMPMPGSGG